MHYRIVKFFVVAACVFLFPLSSAQGAEIEDMTNEQLAEHLQKKAESYTPPPEAEKALPFDSFEWETNRGYARIGDPDAGKGGGITTVWNSFPPNLRTDGPNSNLIQTHTIHGLMYESLVGVHPTTLRFIPQLADHWWISEDKRTFRFHINPKARFADGSEVTADDVYWSFWHLTQEDRRDPYNVKLFKGSFDTPEILGKYTIQVHTKKLNWRLFLYFGASVMIFPAEYIHITGEEYLNGYQWRFIPGSGPYEMPPDGLNKPKGLILKRRKDWWAEKERWAAGRFNFDRIRFTVVTDEKLEFEKFKHRELDYYVVTKAQRWVEECNFPEVRKGWVRKRRVKTEAPQGFSGFVFNMRKPPFDDRRVRLAWAHLFNREKLLTELFFNQYQYIDSYYPGRVWANPGNPKIRYNPRLAKRLLEEAGYEKRNEEGILIGPDGKPFELTLEFGQKSFERVLTVIAGDYRKAGINLKLKLLDPRTCYKKVSERKFKIAYQWWGAIVFPNPESSWASDLADKPHNNNIPGFKSARVDYLCKKYDRCFDQEERIQLIRKIDGLVFREHPYALGWYSNRTRILYWDKFGHPEEYFSRIGDYRDVLDLWWYDPEKARELERDMRSDTKRKQGKVEVAPWED